MSHAPNISGDYRAIGKRRTELCGESWLVVEKMPPLQPIQHCDLCKRVFDPNTGETRGSCSGECAIY